MVKKIISIIASFLLVMILGVTAVSAAGGLNVALLNQNPDPVSPGNFVYLNVKVSNIGSDVIKEAYITFDENNNFEVAKGEDVEKNLGSLSAFSTSDNTNSFIVAKYKILVDENTPSGLNTVSFDVRTSSGTYTYDFDILVQDANPQILVKDIKIPQTKPGSNTKMSLTIENQNSITLKDVKVALDLADVDGKILNLNDGSNEQVIGDLKSGEFKTIEYDVVVSPEAESKPYLLPITISYDDNLENSFSTTFYGSVKVYSEPELSLTLNSQDIYTTGKGKFSLAIANPGSSKIKGVQLEVLESDDYEIIQGENQYVGDLNPDDFQTLQGDIYIKNADNAVLNVRLTYGDSYDNRETQNLEIPLKIYNDEQLKELGFSSNSSSGGSFVSYIVVILLTAIVTFFVVRRSFKKRLGKKA